MTIMGGGGCGFLTEMPVTKQIPHSDDDVRWMLGDLSVGGYSSSFLLRRTNGCSYDRRLHMSELMFDNPAGRGTALLEANAAFFSL